MDMSLISIERFYLVDVCRYQFAAFYESEALGMVQVDAAYMHQASVVNIVIPGLMKIFTEKFSETVWADLYVFVTKRVNSLQAEFPMYSVHNLSNNAMGEVDKLREVFPALSVRVAHPDVECDDPLWNPGMKEILRQAIIHMNDYHKWSREQIADWLESTDIDMSMKND